MTHWLAVDQCHTDHDAARRHARHALALIESRPPQEIEVDNSIYHCDGRRGCTLDTPALQQQGAA